MDYEQKTLLLKDICARLPYKTICKQVIDGETVDCELSVGALGLLQYDALEIKPYLRSMSSMTEEEKEEINEIIIEFGNKWFEADNADGHWNATFWECSEIIDYLIIRHFDYRGLIPMGLALEAPKDMYKTE